MIVTNYSNFRQNMAQIMDKIQLKNIPAIITRESKEPLVNDISLEDFNSYQEALYLISNKANKKRLEFAVEDLKSKKYQEKELIEP